MRPVSSATGMNSAGSDRAQLRVVPAGQRLEADHAAAELDHRLVGDGDLARRQRPAELLLEVEPTGGSMGQRGVEGLEATTAEGLGLLHRDVRRPDQRGRLRRRAVHVGQADAEADGQASAADGDGLGEGIQHVPADRGGGRQVVDAFTEDHELVASVAGHRAGDPDRGPQPSRHRGEQGVAGGVTEALVDRLEAVDVEEQGGHQRRALTDAGDGPLGPVQEQGAVGQPGDLVDQRPVGQVALVGPALGDVPDEPPQLARRHRRAP